MAIVQDKEENTLGIVTMEDVLEELVSGVDEGGDSNE
jgi:CBS domain containing-hemolysin-like protein